jgi:hypothetical protein
MYDYDRRRAAEPRLEHVLDRPAKADEALGEAYRALISFKQGLDSMAEIPSQLRGLYSQVNKAVGEVAEARQHTYQLREMTKHLPR